MSDVLAEICARKREHVARSKAALPDLMASPAASTVTFGRASYTIATTPNGTRTCLISRPLGWV